MEEDTEPSPTPAPPGPRHPRDALVAKDPAGSDALVDGRFRLQRLLGQGGMGSVFLAFDEAAQRQVAIKFLNLGDETSQRRFQREAEVTAKLTTPHVIRIHGTGQHGDQAYLVYELIEGQRSLEDAFKAGSEDQRLDWIGQIAQGLAAAHAQGVVHRDLKPENVLVRQCGKAVVLDFGLAGLSASSLTSTGQVLGTPAYMSPEQVRGAQVTPAADVWSLGLLLYEALYQRHPLLEPGITIHLLLARIFAAEIETPPGPSWALRRLLRACLASDPADRPADAGEFLRALGEARAGGSGRGRAHRAPFLLALGLVGLVLGWGLWPPGSPPAPERSEPSAGSSEPRGVRYPTLASPAASSGPAAALLTRELSAPTFVLDQSASKSTKALFLSRDQVLFANDRAEARVWSLAGPRPRRGDALRLKTLGETYLIANSGPLLVITSLEVSWRATLPLAETVLLPTLPFAPAWISVWHRGSVPYLAIGREDRIAVGALGDALVDLKVSGYEIMGLCGGGDRVVALARKLPSKASGILVFVLDRASGIWQDAGAPPTALALSLDQDLVFLGTREGQVQVRTGRDAGGVEVLPSRHAGGVRDLHSSGRLVGVLSQSLVTIWSTEDLRAPLFRADLPPGPQPDRLEVSPGGELLLVRRGFRYLGWRLPPR